MKAEFTGRLECVGLRHGVPLYRVVRGAVQGRVHAIPDEKRLVEEGRPVVAGQLLSA